jgi:tripartite-type tricarboxylate transporter receptor subunit TctC
MRKAFLILGALTTLCLAAKAEDAAGFYAGKTIRIIVGIGVGSGFDINARVLARHLPRYIPGHPSIIVQNQPGAGSVTMTNQLYAAGPFDGTVIGACFSGLPMAPLLQPASVRFDATKLNWIGSTNRESNILYAWHESPFASLEDLRSKQMIVGAQAPGSTQYDYPVLATHLFGMKFKVITGYESTPKIHLAMERGEVNGTLANWSTIKAIAADWVRDRKIRMLAQFGLKPNPELADVPMFLDVAKTEADRQALVLAVARLEFGRPFFMPPNVPQERVEAVRRAFDATMADKEFLAEAEKLKVDVDPLTGEQVADLIAQLYRTPADVVARVRTAMESR